MNILPIIGKNKNRAETDIDPVLKTNLFKMKSLNSNFDHLHKIYDPKKGQPMNIGTHQVSPQYKSRQDELVNCVELL